MSLTDSILSQVSSLGFTVSTHRANSTIEMHAVELIPPHEQFIAHVIDGDGRTMTTDAPANSPQLVGLKLDDG